MNPSTRRGSVDAWLAARSTRQIGALSALLVAAIGLVDHVTGYELAVSVFYLLPVAVGAWYAGREVGLAACLASAATWLLVDFTSGHPYSSAAFPYWNALVRLGFFVVVALLLVRLREALGQLQLQAQVDALTGLLNARALRERYRLLAGLAERHDQALAVAYIDVDGFKGVNDSLGHAVGDQVLQEVAGVLSHRLRHTDAIGRIGGDEFAVVLPDTDGTAARAVLEEARAALAETVAARSWPVGFSIGVAVFPRRCPPADAAFGFADALMYSVKRSGGDRVLVADCAAAAAGASVAAAGPAPVAAPARPRSRSQDPHRAHRRSRRNP